VPRGGPADDGLAPKGRNPGDRRHRGEDRDHQEGDRAPLDRMKLLAQPPAEVAGAGDAPDMLGSRRHSLCHRLGGEAQARLATNTSSIGDSSTRAKTLGILVKEAEIAGVTVDVTVGPDRDGQGPASAITIIEGEGEEAFVTTWIGSILWVVQSPLQSHHKRKNWFIGVFRLEGPHLSRYRSNWPTRASKLSVPAARAASTRTGPRAR
jgi:hypothetical protein